ncbi:hypothetical protein BGZ58_003860 [Dissophora ornata]|nr:hypothetical protein BGZ58_003860 [Dissophora ornata]
MIDNPEDRPHLSHAQARAPSTPSSSPAPDRESGGVTDASKKAPAKRVRIPIACVNCRHKKIKCDGQTPCSHCEKFRAECIYPVATKPVNHEYVETLENRLKSVESRLQGLLSMGVENPESVSESLGRSSVDSISEHGDMDRAFGHAPSSTLTTLRPVSIKIPAANPDTRFSGNSMQFSSSIRKPHWGNPTNNTTPAPQRTGDNVTEAQDSSITDSTMNVLGLLMGDLKVDRDGTAKFLSKPNGRSERSYTEARNYSPTTAPPGLSAITETTNLDWESVDLPRPYTPPTSLLPPRAISVLIDIYFNSVHTFLPLLHKTSFLTLCQEGEYRVPPFLLMAICAIASRHATAADLQTISKLGMLSSHHVLFDHARALLDTFMDIPRISTIQGLLLLAYYQIKEKRAGHFLRVRTYLCIAIRMALDMGLARDLHKTVDEMEAAHTGDSISTTVSASHSSSSQLAGQQQPRRADTSFDYGVTDVQLEMRKLIREANSTTDATQGATLIFWYLHLDLVQLYRRICEMYRLFLSSMKNETEALAVVFNGTEMLAIEHGLDTWITTLPAHLVYTGQRDMARGDSQSQTTNDTNLPSYYTLYLHRFYFSLKLLLYRPLIASRAYRGDPSDPNSAISKCAIYATTLTDIGEAIFQNYSWPWPGCGLFAYHMLQAAEIHVYMMITHSRAQDLYHRTMDLVKGYASLLKMPDLERDVLTMKQVVANYVMTPEQATPPTLMHTPFSILQQHGHHFPDTSMQQAPEYAHLNTSPMCMSPTTPIITQLTQQHLHINSPHSYPRPNQQLHHHPQQIHPNLTGPVEDSQMFSPALQSTASFPPFPTPSAETASSSNMFQITPQAGQVFSMSLQTIPTADMRQQQRQQRQQLEQNYQQQQHPSPLSTFLNDMEAPSLSLYGEPATDIFDSGQHHVQSQQQQQQQQQPYSSYMQQHNIPGSNAVGNLIDLTDLTNPAPPPRRPPQISSAVVAGAAGPGDGQERDSYLYTLSSPLPQVSPVSTGLPSHMPSFPPPKPAKRIFPQSTGSTNSSSKSQSQKPPVPKKPSRLLEMGAGTLLAPVARNQYHLQHQQHYQQHYQQQQQQQHSPAYTSGGGSMLPPPSLPPLSSSSSSSAGMGRRPIRVLQAQRPLYGLGALRSPLNQGGEGEDNDDPHEDDLASGGDGETRPEWGYSANHGYTFEYMKANPHLQSQARLNGRPQVL